MPDDIEAGTTDGAEQAQETVNQETQETATVDTTSTETATPEVNLQQNTENQEQVQEDPNKKWESPENPYFKRFNDIQPVASRIYNEYKPYKELGLKPDEIKQILEERKQREQASNLKPWNSGHSDYNKFKQLRNVASEYRSAIQKAGNDPARQQFVQEMFAGKLTEQDLNLMREAEQDRNEMLEKFQADPRGFFAEQVQEVIQQQFAQYEKYTQTRQEAQSWFTDPEKVPLIEKYRDDMIRFMDPNVPARDKAVEVAQLKAELDQLRARLGQSARQDVQGSARQSMLQKQTRQGFAPRAPKQDIGDPVSYLQKKGLTPGTQEFAKQLEILNRK